MMFGRRRRLAGGAAVRTATGAAVLALIMTVAIAAPAGATPETTEPAQEQLAQEQAVPTQAVPTQAAQAPSAVAPNPPTIASPADGSSTESTVITITGTRASGNSVIVTEGGVVLCTAGAAISTTWSCMTPVLAPGVHEFSAVQVSPDGEESEPSATVSITIVQRAVLTVQHFAESTAVPGRGIPYFAVLTNNGPGSATAAQLVIAIGGLVLSDCSIDGVAVACSVLTSGTNPTTLASGGRLTVGGIVSIPVGTAVGAGSPLSAEGRSTTPPATPARSSMTLTAVAPVAPVITSPAEGQQTTARMPVARGGGALPGATVAVSSGLGAYCTATVAGDGSWSCRPSGRLPVGTNRLVATQDVDGYISPSSAPVSFRIVELAAPPTAAPEPGVEEPPETSLDAIGVDLAFAGERMNPGGTAILRGTIGPNLSTATVAIEVSGALEAGTTFRSAAVEPNGECEADGQGFTCSFELEPGASATADIRVHASALQPPDAATAVLRIDSSFAPQSTTFMTSIDVTPLAAALEEDDAGLFPVAVATLGTTMVVAAATATMMLRRRRGTLAFWRTPSGT